MNGVLPTLALVGLAAAGSFASRRGSLAVRCATLAEIKRAIREENEDFLLVHSPYVYGQADVTLGHLYRWVPRWSRVSDMEPTWVYNATRALCDFLDSMPFPLVIYRGLLRDKGSTVRFQGAHWTPDPDIALLFANGTHDTQIDVGFDVAEQHARTAPAGAIAEAKEGIVLVGLLRDPSIVDWNEVHKHFFLFSLDNKNGKADKNPRTTEREVYLQPGFPVEILEVRRIPAPARPGRRWYSDTQLGKDGYDR